MSAPLVVNTTDGTCWTRREGTRDGQALYAPEKCGQCPEFVMATLTELAEHGIAGSADALPMPVGPEPQAPAGHAELAELRAHGEFLMRDVKRLRARVAELKAAPRMAFRASHDSIVMGHYSNREAARKHCETLLRRELGDEEWTGWVPDDGSEDAPEELCFSEEVLCSGYVVTALTVASAFDEEADE